MKKVLVCDPMDAAAFELLTSQNNLEVDNQPDISLEELQSVIGNYDAVFIRSRTKLRQETLENATNLKVIGRAGTGLDNVDVEFAESKGIQVLNTPGANANAVAELTIGLMLMLARRVMQGIETIRAGEPKKVKGIELEIKTLGLVGFGNIGRLVARLAKGFKMDVMAYDPMIDHTQIPEALRIVPLCSLEELLQHSDFVSLHVPFMDSTKHIINANRLAMMRPGAFLLNTARAGLTDDAAVLAALESGQLGGYATDLHEEANPLFEHPNVIVTPHIGASTLESQRRAGEGIVNKVIEALNAL